MQLELDSRFHEVEVYVQRACAATSPEEIQSYLFRFGTVLICGYVEQSIQIIIMHRLANKAQPRILNFVKSHFGRGTNYNCPAIEQLLNRFDPAWSGAFSKFTGANIDVTEGIASCYAVRNSVAHGGSASVGSARLNQLLIVGKKLVDGVVRSTQ